MVRTVGSDGSRTEAAIRAAAIELIAAKGFEAVTLRGIAKHVGLQAGSLYRYFPSKNDLLTMIVTAHLEDLLAEWEKARARQTGVSPRERLDAFIEFHVRYHAAKPREVFIANMEMRSLAKEDREKVVALRKRYEGILRDILQDGIDQGTFAMPDIRITTFAILAMLTGLTAWYQEGGRLSRGELAACYSQLVTTGVTKAR